MIAPDKIKETKAKRKPLTPAEIIAQAREELEQHVDREMLLDENKEDGYLCIRLDTDYRRYSYRNTDGVDFYKDILEPVVQKYKDAGWFVYCMKWMSFMQRDALFFYKTPRPERVEGYNITWRSDNGKFEALNIVKNKSDLYTPQYKTRLEAEHWFKIYTTQ